MSNPNLLFVSPVFPDLSGNGLAMRAGSLIEALAHRYRLFLLIVSLQDSPKRSLNMQVASWCAQHAVVRPPRLPRLMRPVLPKPPEWRSLSASFLKRATGVFPDILFSGVYVFRLCLAPIGLHIMRNSQPGVIGVLDLDEVESRTRRGLAECYRENGQHESYRRVMWEAGQYEALEDYYIPLFDQVVLCSEREAELMGRHQSAKRVTVIPNAVRIPDHCAAAPRGDPHTLLFVGNPNYFPNVDALEFLSSEILSPLRSIVAKPVHVDVVGFEKPASPGGNDRWSGFSFLGSVPSVEPYYETADAVVVPLRAGGGTRIKILEAFSHRRPVVSTPKGAEGLAVESGRHLLLADDAHEFAEHCARLIREPELSSSLADEAFRLVSKQYSQGVVDRLLSTELVC